MAQMKDSLYFVTDAHLGSGTDSPQRERELCQWLRSIEPRCRTLVMLGDMFDFWFTYRHVVPRGHVRLLGTLAEMSDRGTDLHFYIGNHDMWVFDYLTAECGITLHTDPEVMEYDGRRFLVGHGDGLGHTDPAFDLVRRLFRSRLCQRLLAVLPPAMTFPVAQRWSDNNKRRHARHDTLRYLGDDREGIVIHCKQELLRQKIDYCVFGHRHTPLTMPLSESCTYINVGDWLHNRNYACCSPGQPLQLHNLSASASAPLAPGNPAAPEATSSCHATGGDIVPGQTQVGLTSDPSRPHTDQSTPKHHTS